MNFKEEVENLIEEQIGELKNIQAEDGGVVLTELLMQDTDGVYSLEVENPNGQVTLAYPVESKNVQEVKQYFTQRLAERGIKVLNCEGN